MGFYREHMEFVCTPAEAHGTAYLHNAQYLLIMTSNRNFLDKNTIHSCHGSHKGMYSRVCMWTYLGFKGTV